MEWSPPWGEGATSWRGTNGASSLGSLQSLDWNGGMEWWNEIVECVLQGERSLLLQCFFLQESDC